MKTRELADESPFKAKGYTVVKQWSFEDSRFKRVARPDIYRSSMTKTFYDMIVEERQRKKKEDKNRQATDIIEFMRSPEESPEPTTRPLSAIPSPSYLRDTGLDTKVWTKRPFSARCERPGHHTPRRPFFKPSAESHSNQFKDKVEERIVYFHELDAQSKLVQSKRFMLERISGRDKKRTLSRPQSAETWRRHHFNKGNKENKLSNLLTVKGMDLKRQTS